jgi:hypothetical protein
VAHEREAGSVEQQPLPDAIGRAAARYGAESLAQTCRDALREKLDGGGDMRGSDRFGAQRPPKRSVDGIVDVATLKS